jgi:hypothetical protein
MISAHRSRQTYQPGYWEVAIIVVDVTTYIATATAKLMQSQLRAQPLTFFLSSVVCPSLSSLSSLPYTAVASRPVDIDIVDMSTYPAAYPPSSYLQHPHPQQQHPADEFKPQYDDLIDDYGAPYGKTLQHQTYAVEAPSLSPVEHRRRPSFPLTNKSYSSEFTTKGSDEVPTEASRAYPPSFLPTKESDPRSFWQKVYHNNILAFVLLSDTLPRFYRSR